MWPVRWLHVTGAAIALGGAVLAWTSLRLAEDETPTVPIAYEWLFWGAISVLAMTGVGNLGALAPTVPPITTRWGQVLALKLLGVLALLLGSVTRSALAIRISAGSWRNSSGLERLRRAYAATAIWLLALLALAEVLAHG